MEGIRAGFVGRARGQDPKEGLPVSISRQNGNGDPYSARRMAKPVNFFLTAPQARSVSVIGDFNQWNPAANPMQRRIDGAWFAQISLTHGHHQYQFLVDGRRQTDPQAMGAARDEHGEKVSLVAVSCAGGGVEHRTSIWGKRQRTGALQDAAALVNAPLAINCVYFS